MAYLDPDAVRFREARDKVRWSNRIISDEFQCDERMVRRWAAGQIPVPAAVLEHMTYLEQAHSRPPPQDWRVRRRPSAEQEQAS